MKTIKLEFDFLIGPIVKEVFSISQNKLITGVYAIDNDIELNKLNEKACSLYSSFYEFGTGEACTFNKKIAIQHKDELSELMNKIIERLNTLNDGTYSVRDLTKDQLDNIN